MSNARQGWNAAQIASERPLPGRKALAPVGVRTALPYPGDNSCSHCGYHMCNCANNPAPTCAPFVPSCNAPNCCCDKCWAELKPAEPALLTYDQAVAACAAGKTVEIVTTPANQLWVGVPVCSSVKGYSYFYDGHWQPAKDLLPEATYRIVP